MFSALGRNRFGNFAFVDMNAASLFTEIRNWLDWAPDWLTAIFIIAVAIAAALAIHAAGFAALRRIPY